jgi:hypothetical protein
LISENMIFTIIEDNFLYQTKAFIVYNIIYR